MRGKKGNEILQTIVVIALLGAVAITVCVLISSKLKSTTKNQLNSVGDGLGNAVGAMDADHNGGYDPYK